MDIRLQCHLYLNIICISLTLSLIVFNIATFFRYYRKSLILVHLMFAKFEFLRFIKSVILLYMHVPISIVFIKLKFALGPFKHYVINILTFLDPTHPVCNQFWLTSQTIQVYDIIIWYAPPTQSFDYIIFEWSLIKSLLFE